MKLHALLPLALLAAPVAHAQQTAQHPDFEYHGYMRSGIGASRGGTDQVCFGQNVFSAKFRLGNECQTYLEAAFVKHMHAGKTAGAPDFRTNLRLAAVSAGRSDWEGTPNDLTLALREAYVEVDNVLGEARPWVGKRFYRRQDIHILDYYIINNSGPGAGVENIGLGAAKLHVAATRNAPQDKAAGPTQTNVDVRLSDLKLGDAGSLEILAIHGATSKRDHETNLEAYEAMNGTQLGLVHNMGVLGGFNRVTLQYGVGLFGGVGSSRAEALGSFATDKDSAVAKGDKDGREARKDSSTMRVVEELVAQFGKTASTSFVLLYQTTDFGGYKATGSTEEAKKRNELLAGVRPVVNLSEHTAVALEYGYSRLDNAFGDKPATLQKITLAPQISAGDDFWARPQLRVFGTYAAWNDDAKGALGEEAYKSDTKGFTTGAQLEAWW